MCAGLHCSGFMSTSSFPQVLLKPYADRRSTTSRSSLQIIVNYSLVEYFLITIQPPRTRVRARTSTCARCQPCQFACSVRLRWPVQLLQILILATSHTLVRLVVYIKYVTTKYVASERTDLYCGEYVSCTLRALGTRETGDWGNQRAHEWTHKLTFQTTMVSPTDICDLFFAPFAVFGDD